MSDHDGLEYVGFWLRVGAALVDTLVMLAAAMLLIVVFGGDMDLGPDQGLVSLLANWIAPFVLTVLFWKFRQATPGKMLWGARIVDARTGLPPSTGQMVGRYLGYFVSTLGLGLGFVWVAFDARKQGWHDKLAGTVVVRPSHHGQVRFEQPAPGGTHNGG